MAILITITDTETNSQLFVSKDHLLLKKIYFLADA